MSRGSAPHSPLVTVIDEIMRLGPRLRSLFSAASAASGLTPLETTVLTAVAESRAPPTVPQIGRSLGHHRQVVQRAATALIDRGLLATQPNPDHKRASLLGITPTGNETYRKVAGAAGATLDQLHAVVDAAECQRIAGELAAFRIKIETHLREMRRNPDGSAPPKRAQK